MIRALVEDTVRRAVALPGTTIRFVLVLMGGGYLTAAFVKFAVDARSFTFLEVPWIFTTTWFLVACVVFPIGLAWVALSPRRRSLQDLVVWTRVVYAG